MDKLINLDKHYNFKGSFGKIYIYKFNNHYKIIKKQHIKNSTLKNEANIYIKLKNINFIPKIYNYYRDGLYDYIIIDYIGIDLNKYKCINYNTKNYIKKIIIIIINSINIVKNIHNIGIIHRDIKPANICIKNNTPYLIDFGLSKFYIEKEYNTKQKNINNIIGSINYISCNILNLIEPSRRDDIESFLYILLYMIISDNEYKNYNNLENFYKKDKNIISLYLCKYLNVVNLNILICYIKSLKYHNKPNYNYINSLFLLL